VTVTWRKLLRPSTRFSVGALVLVGVVGSLLFWGGLTTAVEYSNTLEFCTSCHEMRAFVFEEYQQTTHYRNPSGVRAICSDCHVPKPWAAKMRRKIMATLKEVPHKVLGSINTAEKFEAKRLTLAEEVWAAMRATDSRECRNCHTHAAMALDRQKPRARAQHEDALKTGETCIDCHRGIAHKMPTEPSKAGSDDEFGL
jgi:cytochrome c-type protein NapC